MPPIKFTLKKYVGWKKLFENFQEGCLVHDHLIYLSRRIEGFMSLFFTWPTQTNFCSWRHMVWRNMLFEEYQNCCLVLCHPDILIELVYLFRASMLPGFCSSGHMVWKKNLFDEFQEGCFMHDHLRYLNGMIWAIQGLCFALVSAQIDIWLGEDIVWSTKDSCHGGTFCWLWVYNPKFNALQTWPPNSTNEKMVSWVLNSSEQ